MSDIKDVLERHADSVTDRTTDRLVDVHRRIDRSRRRRTTARGAVALALVAVVAVGVTLVQRNDTSPPPASLVGRAVPPVTDSLGYRFSYRDAETGKDGRLRMRLSASDRPRLIRWASATSAGLLMLDPGNGEDPWTGPAGDFGDFVLIPAGGATTVTLTQRGARSPGEVAVAVYDLSGAAAGVTTDGVTFRDRVGDLRLFGAAVGRAGRRSLSFTVDRDTTASTRLRLLCSASSDDEIHAFVGSKDLGNTSCDPDPASYDPGNESSSLTLGGIAGGTTIRLRLVGNATRSSDRIGAGLYAAGADQLLPREIDRDGHRWARAASYVSRTGQREASHEVRGEGRSLAWYSLSGSKVGVVRVTVDDKVVANVEGDSRSFSAREEQGSYTLAAHYSGRPSGKTYLATYALAD